MDEEWIRAWEAYEKVQALIPLRAAEAICERAHDGLIAARAERLILGEKVIEPANVPKDFWWARGGAAMDAKWAVGDFETWIEGRIHCRAYSVEFARADIERMLPRSARAIEGATATAEGVARVGNFESARRCLFELTNAIGGDEARAIDLILRNCRAGLIPSRCAHFWCRRTDRYGSEEETDTNIAVPDWAWEHCLSGEAAILNWPADRFAGEGVVDGETRKVKLSGLQFDVESIVALERMGRNGSDKGSVSPQAEAAETSAKASGRKLSELWPDWVAELVNTIHYDGLPTGVGSQGQEELIKRVADALAARGLEAPARTTVQATVQAVLDRLRAGN